MCVGGGGLKPRPSKRAVLISIAATQMEWCKRSKETGRAKSSGLGIQYY